MLLLRLKVLVYRLLSGNVDTIRLTFPDDRIEAWLQDQIEDWLDIYSGFLISFRMRAVSFIMYRMMVVLGRMVALATTMIVTRGGLERRMLGTLMVTTVITTRGGLERSLMGTLMMDMMRTLVFTALRWTLITKTSPFWRPLETTSKYSSASISVLHSSFRYLRSLYTIN
jgi:hypothetical protein